MVGRPQFNILFCSNKTWLDLISKVLESQKFSINDKGNMVWKNQKIGIGNVKICKEVISVLCSLVDIEGPLLKGSIEAF